MVRFGDLREKSPLSSLFDLMHLADGLTTLLGFDVDVVSVVANLYSI